MANEYYKNQNVNLSCTFDVDDTPTDPTEVTLYVLEPDGTLNEYTYGEAEITKTDTGDYEKSIAADVEGTWRYGFVGSGAVATAEFDEFVVREWPFSEAPPAPQRGVRRLGRMVF